MRLEHKVALITGGYGGMGRASARLFAEEGATVFVAGRNQERGDALTKEITDSGGKAYFVELDVVDQDQWGAAVAQVKEQAGALHVLMNIVGSNALVRFPAVDIDDWNIRSNVIQPGWIETDMTAKATKNPIVKKAQGHVLANQSVALS